MPISPWNAEMDEVVLRYRSLILIVVIAVVLLAGCKESADGFFTGRPSGMATVHNRVIAGPPEAMADLLRVPSRFPDATKPHIANWQESVIAWWRHPEKQRLVIVSFGKLSHEEMSAFKKWITVRDRDLNKEKLKALGEIEAAMNAAVLST
jgi:hypothetical protein